MPDEPNTQTAPTEPLGNTEEARNPDGSLKNQAASPPPTEAQAPKTEAKAEPGAETKPAPKAGAPETYESFTAPEGFTIDEDTVAKATPLFKELNLDQAGAQRLVDFYADISREAAEAPFKQYETIREDWRNEIISGPLGNGRDGLKPEVAATIGRALDSLPPNEASAFRQAMVLTGAGDNPAFIAAFYSLAQRVGEGTQVRGGGPSPAGQTPSGQDRRSAAAVMFPNLPSSAR